MEAKIKKPIPLWGWPLLILLLGASGLILSFIGSDFVIANAHWSDGIWWGIAAGIPLAFSLWSCRVRSESLTLIVAIFFFFFIQVNTQINYYSKSKSELFTIIQNAEDNEWPNEWKQLDRDTLYNTFTEQRINTSGFKWLDHLRVQADIGVIRVEQQGHRKYGGRKGVEVYRQGFWMWWGWFICYLLLAVGCFFGMAGSSFIDKEESKEKKVADIIVGRMTKVLKEKGLSDENIRNITQRQKNYYKTLNADEVHELLPIEDEKISSDIVNDLMLSKEWYVNSKIERTIDEHKLVRLNSLLNKYYQRTLSNEDKLYSYYLVLLAADTLCSNSDNMSFYQSLLCITDIAEILNIPHNITSFNTLDLNGINYKTLAVGEIWAPLFGREQSFYSYNSNWELLEDNKADDIPEEAYLAIIYQYCHQPDPRGYEMWQGTTPSEFMEILSPKLRDAILTYLSLSQSSFPEQHLSKLMQLADWAAYWSDEQAEEIFKRCIQAGWRQSLRKIPETPSWRKFIEENDNTPFGNLSNVVEWF